MSIANIFHTFPEIPVSNDIVLRNFIPQDAEDYYALLHHPQVKPYIPDSMLPASVHSCQQEIESFKGLFVNQRSVYWAIAERTHNRLIGTCGFDQWHKHHSRLELAYELHPDYWSRGIASQSINQIVRFGFHDMQINRVEAYCLTDNIPSIRLLIGLGFQQDGLLRQFRMFNGRYRDVLLFSLLRPLPKTSPTPSWLQNIFNRWQ